MEGIEYGNNIDNEGEFGDNKSVRDNHVTT